MAEQKQITVITGATRGIGKAIADKLYEPNREFILTGTSETSYRELQKSAPSNVSYQSLDLADDGSVDAFISGLGAVDVLINNAGINRISDLTSIPHSDFSEVLKVNLGGPFRLCQAVSESMMRQRRGHIVNIASIWSVVTKAGRTSYSAAKSGLHGLSRALAVELAAHNVIVNTVSPGFVLTDLTRESLSEEEMRTMSNLVPMQRMAEPEEIASVVKFLVSPDCTYLTGQNIVVDGGFTGV